MTERICSNWRYVPIYMPQLWEEMEENFYTIHSEHVKRVQANIQLLARKLREVPIPWQEMMADYERKLTRGQ